MLEIWGRPYSSNVIPVIWTAEELGLDYVLKLAGGSFGQLDTPEFGDMNPNRMIPTINAPLQINGWSGVVVGHSPLLFSCFSRQFEPNLRIVMHRS